MARLIGLKYYGLDYPEAIEGKIREVAGHFDIGERRVYGPYCLHTEYSYARRNFSNSKLQGLDAIKEAKDQGIPLLWYSDAWTEEFIVYIERLLYGLRPPNIIELHPAFDNYLDLEGFLSRYAKFEKGIKKIYPDVELLLENRSGSLYSQARFLVETKEDLKDLSKIIDRDNLDLKIALDLPQLITAEIVRPRDYKEKMDGIFSIIKEIRHNIRSIHLWGKKGLGPAREAHKGDLDDYFRGHMEIKEYFLRHMFEAFQDNRERYFLPELNSSSKELGNKQLKNIVEDLKSVGFEFV